MMGHGVQEARIADLQPPWDRPMGAWPETQEVRTIMAERREGDLGKVPRAVGGEHAYHSFRGLAYRCQAGTCGSAPNRRLAPRRRVREYRPGPAAGMIRPARRRLPRADALDRSGHDGVTIVVVDPLRGVALRPDVGEPEADAELDAELLASRGALVVVLVLEHRRRYVQHVAGLPALGPPLHVAVSLTFEDVDHRLQMLVAPAVMVRWVLEDEGHRHAGGLETVPGDDQIAGDGVLLLNCREMTLRVIGLVGRSLLQMDDGAAVVSQVL